MEKQKLCDWLSEELNRTDLWVVGANNQYDMEGLWSLGVEWKCKWLDVQLIEALIDEEQISYALNTLCVKYLGKCKDESLLNEAARAHGVDPKGGLWKLHAKYVGPYAEFDAACCLKILDEQLKEIQAQDLKQIFELEHKLLPIIFQMRLNGIKIDMDVAKSLSADLKVQEDDLRIELIRDVGRDIDVWSNPQLASLCGQRNIQFPRTLKGNPSFTADWIRSFSDPTIQLISEIREVNRMRQTFVDDWVFGNLINGRIHPQWRQIASDDGGTRTGRMAASNPNPQQVPAAKRRNGQPNPIGKKIRSMFIADDGDWLKGDYSQQEPRILTHFAAICGFTGAVLARLAYQTNPEMDFYQFMVEAAGINRRMAKDMYLGRCYGMGKKKLAMKINKPLDECENILRDFDEKVPFVKEIADKCMQLANTRGYVRTLCGRRRHFNLWEPSEYGKMGYGEPPLRKEEAEKKWGKSLKRSNAHKALNALIQGSAADMMKSAIILMWEEMGKVPYITVHDELGVGVQSPEEVSQIKHIMEHCVEMTVPVGVEIEVGKTWK